MILVTGGAGYIGSHMVLKLRERGIEVLVLDNLSTGHQNAVIDATHIIGDTGDYNLLDKIFTQYPITAVMHFAAFIEVGESVIAPQKYYDNNFVKTKVLLDAMVRHEVRYFIFSSTAAVFGEPHYTPIDLAHPKQPINPYGRAKHMVEMLLEDYDRAYGLKSVSLRYFNAAGADPQGRLGERHSPETHLIPLVLQVAKGQREAINIYGDDYDTPDGTCIRDYIHIVDLCEAHLLALDYLKQVCISRQFNLGNGVGFSVREVINTVAKVTGAKIKIQLSARRAGDPARLVADATVAKTLLGWQPQYPDLETIIAHAWRFMLS